ncbi:MAG: penicillin-binding protein 2 [Caldisericia bacterium]
MENDFKPNLTRLGLILVCILILFSLLVIKLFKVQFIDADAFVKKAGNTGKTYSDPILPMRGEIFDRQGYPLATNILKYDIGVEPKRINNKGWFAGTISEEMQPIVDSNMLAISTLFEVRPEDIENDKGMATVIAYILNLDEDMVHRTIQGNSTYKLLAREVGARDAEKLRRFKLEGIVINGASKRLYPEGFLASNLIGWTGVDNQGLSGIEYALNDVLAGEIGEKIHSQNLSSNDFDITVKPATDGIDIYLSIDSMIQMETEKTLEKHCEKWDAEGGCSIVCDPLTGEIFAMATYPNFNLNKWKETEESIRNMNRATNFTYDHGSVIKGLVTAVALEEDVINEETVFYCEGYTIISKKKFTCPLKAHGTQNLLEILQNSCNMGFIQVGQKIGKDKFYNGLKKFGLGETPDSVLGGSSGVFNKPKYSTDLPAMSFGTSMSATPLQLTMAYSAIVNKGIMLDPIIVRQDYNPNNGESKIFKPKESHRAISEETASRTMNLLIENTNAYSGISKLKEEYTVAGKTGTAHIWDKEIGGYNTNKRNCSFVGIVPADPSAERKVVIFTTIEYPKASAGGTTPWGSTVAIPCFSEIAPKVLSMLYIKGDKQHETQ